VLAVAREGEHEDPAALLQRAHAGWRGVWVSGACLVS
jgi:hypothetical protein